MPRILVLFGSSYGHTALVAQRLASGLTAAGHAVEIQRGDKLPDGFDPAQFDGIVIGASIIIGHYQAYIRQFGQREVKLLNRLPAAFVSVCGAAGTDPAQAQAYIDGLLLETGWLPRLVRSFPGAAAYTRYAWWYRWYLRLINRHNGRPTDTSRDWDFTDWSEVDRFAAELANSLVPTAPAVAGNAASCREVHVGVLLA